MTMTVTNWQIIIECLKNGSLFVRHEEISDLTDLILYDTGIPVIAVETSVKKVYQIKIKTT